MLRRDRAGSQRDLVLHLPDELFVVDRKRETAIRYAYEFTVDGVSTAGLPRDTPPTDGAHDHPTAVLHNDLPARAEPGSYARTVERARERFARAEPFAGGARPGIRAP